MDRLLTGAVLSVLVGLCGSCGSGVGLFNNAFLNSAVGGVFPVTPGPEASFVFVRVVNETSQVAEFIVTIERDVIEIDDNGNALLDNTGELITRQVMETKRLTTMGQAPANEVGVLFSCKTSPVNIVGLGQELLPTDAAVFIGGTGTGAGGTPGFGIPSGALKPLVRELGDFACGDTIIFRAIRSNNEAGGVRLQSFLLSGAGQRSSFAGPSTFVNLERFLESQVREEQ